MGVELLLEDLLHVVDHIHDFVVGVRDVGLELGEGLGVGQFGVGLPDHCAGAAALPEGALGGDCVGVDRPGVRVVGVGD